MIGRARCLNAPDTRRDFASECRIATSHASAAALWGHSAIPARGEVKSSARGGFRIRQAKPRRVAIDLAGGGYTPTAELWASAWRRAA